MARGTKVRPKYWLTAAAIVAAVTATAHGSSAFAGDAVAQKQTTLPSGWWRGSITVVERWDLQVGSATPRQVGEATLTIERIGPSEARYSVRYRDDAQYGDCRHWRHSGSWSGSGPIDVQVATGKSGFEFLVWPTQARGRPLLTFRVTVESLNCDGTVKDRSEITESIRALHFTSRDPASARLRKGTQLIRAPSAEANAAPAGKVGLYFNRRPQSGQGTTEISWNLQLQSSSPPTSRAPIRLAEPFFAHSQYETNVFFPLLRAGGRVLELDRAPRCTGRIVNGPAFDEMGPPFVLGTDYFASFERVEKGHTRFLPALRRYLGKPLALVGCRFYYESSFAASRKTLRGSISVVAGGRKATRSFAFTICDWELKRQECSKKWSGR
jgi:hypothetical protein